MVVAIKEEKRRLTMHENLLMSTIKRQAGTLDKAVLEGSMNSIEAGATKVEIGLMLTNKDGEKSLLTISDDGEGIETREELEQHFEMFGTPHTEKELQQGNWKQFRMGRGQMFAFGRNTWRTSTFEMIVDIKNDGLNYTLREGLKKVKGCHITIELYDHPGAVEKFKEETTRQLKYVEIPVFFNDEQVNTPASECTWDYEDDFACYLFNIGLKLEIYNLGVFVRNYDDGIYGVVVSKEQLKVNFARNDVISDCPIYIHIKDIIKKNRIKKVRRAGKKRHKLTDTERRATLKDLRDDEQFYDDVKSLPLIKTVQGKYLSLNKLSKNRMHWCFAESGDGFGDRLIQQGKALVIDEQILYFLGYPTNGEPKDFFSWLIKKDEYKKINCRWDDDGYYKSYRHNEDMRKKYETLTKFYVDYNDLKGGHADFFTVLEPTKLHKREKAVLKTLKRMAYYIEREVLIGVSNSAAMWTDGATYIVIDREHLKGCNLNSDIGIIRFLMNIAHEMTHDDNTAGTHVHGPEFYEAQIDLMAEYKSPLLLFVRFKDSMRISEREIEQEKNEEKKKKAQAEITEKLKGKKKKQTVAA